MLVYFVCVNIAAVSTTASQPLPFLVWMLIDAAWLIWLPAGIDG